MTSLEFAPDATEARAARSMIKGCRRLRRVLNMLESDSADEWRDSVKQPFDPSPTLSVLESASLRIRPWHHRIYREACQILRGAPQNGSNHNRVLETFSSAEKLEAIVLLDASPSESVRALHTKGFFRKRRLDFRLELRELTHPWVALSRQSSWLLRALMPSYQLARESIAYCTPGAFGEFASERIDDAYCQYMSEGPKLQSELESWLDAHQIRKALGDYLTLYWPQRIPKSQRHHPAARAFLNAWPSECALIAFNSSHLPRWPIPSQVMQQCLGSIHTFPMRIGSGAAALKEASLSYRLYDPLRPEPVVMDASNTHYIDGASSAKTSPSTLRVYASDSLGVATPAIAANTETDTAHQPQEASFFKREDLDWLRYFQESEFFCTRTKDHQRFCAMLQPRSNYDVVLRGLAKTIHLTLS